MKHTMLLLLAVAMLVYWPWPWAVHCSVLIIDSGNPVNRQTPSFYNFITHDGEKPAVIAVRK